VDVVDVLVPAEPVAAPDDLGDAGRVENRPERDLEEPGQVRGAVRVGQCHRLLGRERVAAALGVVVDVAARSLGVQPFPDVPVCRAGARRELGRRHGAGVVERAIETELVSHDHERCVQRRADLLDGTEHELHQPLFVDRGACRRRCHRSSFSQMTQSVDQDECELSSRWSRGHRAPSASSGSAQSSRARASRSIRGAAGLRPQHDRGLAGDIHADPERLAALDLTIFDD
jgi:hypothetical protein